MSDQAKVRREGEEFWVPAEVSGHGCTGIDDDDDDDDEAMLISCHQSQTKTEAYNYFHDTTTTITTTTANHHNHHHQDLVKGDMVLLESGQRVPADIRILETDSLKVQEEN